MNKNQSSITALIALCAIMAFAAWWRSQPDSGTPPKDDPATAEAQSTPPPGGQAKLKLPRLIDLGAKECIPCKKLAPILEELREEYEGRLDVVFIDVWENPEAKKPYDIRLIPTQILFDAQGKELWRHEGFISKKDLKSIFAQKAGVD